MPRILRHATSPLIFCKASSGRTRHHLKVDFLASLRVIGQKVCPLQRCRRRSAPLFRPFKSPRWI